MAVEDKRTAKTVGGVAGGAATGAALGTAIAPGVGTLVGAGVGALAGGIGGYILGEPSEYDLYREEQIKDLKRRQELGLLGLTDEERANLEAQLIEPIRGQQREAYYRGQAAMAGVADAGTAAKMNLGQQQRMAEALQPAQTEIARADLQKAKYEEELLMALQFQEQAEVDAIYNQALNSLLTGAQVSAQAAVQLGQIDAMKSQQAAMLAAAGISPQAAAGYSGQSINQGVGTYNQMGGNLGGLTPNQ